MLDRYANMHTGRSKNSMSKKFSVSIKGLQSYAGDQENTDIELVSECEFYKADGVYFCEYQESEITGLGGTTTTIEIAKDYVALTRRGTVSSQMLFMEGRKTTSIYAMPFGELTIDIHTKSLKTNVTETGGTLWVDYIIDINNASSGRNTFDIKIKEDK
jgi:uncharacterized beta-barrel protein YwiB (DUF1934 family)